jgi:hypothetical protein
VRPQEIRYTHAVFPMLLPALPSAVELGNVEIVSFSGPTVNAGLPPEIGLRDTFGTLVMPSGERLRLSAADLIWTGRMLDGEAGEGEGNEAEKAAILWTLAQRRYWGSADGPRPTSSFEGMGWSTFLQSFSQAINPKWRQGGQFCPTPDTGDCSPARLARRARLATTAWDDLSRASQTVALAFMSGQLPNTLPGAVNFADAHSAYSRPRVYAPQFNNTFFYSSGGASQAWGGSGLYVEPVSNTSFVASLLPGAQGFIDRILAQ